MDRNAAQSRAALVALRERDQARLWCEALEALGLRAEILQEGAPLMPAAQAHAGLAGGGLLVAGLERAAAEHLDPLIFGHALREKLARLELAFALERRIEVSAAERAFARHCGASDLHPRRYPGRDGPAAPPAVAARMRSRDGVPRMDRRYHGAVYADCFVGSAAVDWLQYDRGGGRAEAVELGQHLLEHGVFHHVLKEHPFEDRKLFYRFAEPTPAIEALGLAGLLERFWGRGGLDIDARRYHGRSYDACFVGSEAVDWMVANCSLTREEAVTLGQRLVDLGLAHHVVDEHPFVDGAFFYRFRRHEVPRP